MDLRVIERACAEHGGHYNNKAIGGVGNRVAAAGGGLGAARRAACAAAADRVQGSLGERRTLCGLRV